jgi:hypothetical protein
LEGEYGRLLSPHVLGDLRGHPVIFFLKPLEQEQPLAHTVMAPSEFVVAVVTEPEAAALFLFGLGKAFDGATLDGDGRRGGRFGTRRCGRARRAAGAGSSGRGGALAAGAVYCSRSSNWRAKLIDAARD